MRSWALETACGMNGSPRLGKERRRQESGWLWPGWSSPEAGRVAWVASVTVLRKETPNLTCHFAEGVASLR